MKGSIKIHLAQCKEKFKKENEVLGVKRKIPKEPAELEELLAMDKLPAKMLDEYNNIASGLYNDVGLMK